MKILIFLNAVEKYNIKLYNKPTCLHIFALNTYYTICYKDYSLHKALCTCGF